MPNEKLCQTAWAQGLAPNEPPRETFSLPDFLNLGSLIINWENLPMAKNLSQHNRLDTQSGEK